MVENPVITEYVYRVLEKLRKPKVEQDLPIRVVIKQYQDSKIFWVI